MVNRARGNRSWPFVGALAGVFLGAAYAALGLLILSRCDVGLNFMGSSSEDGVACTCATAWALPVVFLVAWLNAFGTITLIPFAGGLLGAAVGWRLSRGAKAAPHRKAARGCLLAGAVPALGAMVLLLAVEAGHVIEYIGDHGATRAAKGTDASACEALRDVLQRDTCYLSVAMRTKDPATCAHVSEALDQEACRAKVSALLHGSQQCDSFSSELSRDLCWATVATETGNVANCAHVRDPYSWADCIQQVARMRKDETICELLPIGEQEQCRGVVEEARRK